jgi:3',5'-cyclic-nucleotide phosphodiesterase
VEISYPDPRTLTDLYGHLTPQWLLHELRQFAAVVNAQQPTEALRGVTVIVSHIKPSLQHAQPTSEQIRQQVEGLNNLGLQFFFPEQGDRITF